MKGRRVDDATGQVIAARYLSGETMTAIGQDLGLGGKTVRNVLKRMGVELRPHGLRGQPWGVRVSPKHREIIPARYAAGESVRGIAADLGWSYGAAYGVVRDSGVPMRGHGGRPRKEQP